MGNVGTVSAPLDDKMKQINMGTQCWDSQCSFRGMVSAPLNDRKTEINMG